MKLSIFGAHIKYLLISFVVLHIDTEILPFNHRHICRILILPQTLCCEEDSQLPPFFSVFGFSLQSLTVFFFLSIRWSRNVVVLPFSLTLFIPVFPYSVTQCPIFLSTTFVFRTQLSLVTFLVNYCPLIFHRYTFCITCSPEADLSRTLHPVNYVLSCRRLHSTIAHKMHLPTKKYLHV